MSHTRVIPDHSFLCSYSSKKPNPILVSPFSSNGSVTFAGLPSPTPKSPSLVSPNGPKRQVSVKASSTMNEPVVMDLSTMSLYDLLEIPESGSFSEIKQAYKQLARKYHPDVSPPDKTDEYTKRFIQVQEAYETLSDPSRRAMYDQDLARGFHLAFSARKRYQNRNYHDEGFMERQEWKNQWNAQMTELKKRSVNKDSRKENMSWAARMRRQRSESSV